MIAFRNFYIAAFMALLAMTTIQACSTLDYENVDTTRKAIVVANAEIRGANLLLQDLVTRNAISDNSARIALNKLREAHEALQGAHAAIMLSGDPLAGQSGLERANTALSLAITLLSSFTGDP